MLPLREMQQTFGEYITDENPKTIAHHFKPGILPAEDILKLHRNNFRATLSDALASIFPAIHNLLGEDCFNAYAALFVERCPPTSPVLSAYGAAFPNFLEAQEALSEISYLGDVARLELAWNEVFHSADAAALTPQGLQNAASNDFCLKLHPATRLMQSSRTISNIWFAARNPDEQGGKIELKDCPEHLLIARPQYEIGVSPIDAGTHAMLSSLGKGCEIDEAVEIALAISPEFSLEGSLANLLVRGAFASISLPSEEQTNEYAN